MKKYSLMALVAFFGLALLATGCKKAPQKTDKKQAKTAPAQMDPDMRAAPMDSKGDCPHAKKGDCPHAKKGGCDCQKAKKGDCPHAKKGDCPHANKKGGCDCPKAKKGDCPHGHKGDCPHAKKADAMKGQPALVKVTKKGSTFKPPVEKSQIPAGSWICDMGKVHYARAEKGDGVCPLCKMKLKLKK